MNESEDPKITKSNEIMKNPNREEKNTIHNEGQRKGSVSIDSSTFVFAFKDKLSLSHCYSRQQPYFLLFVDL